MTSLLDYISAKGIKFPKATPVKPECKIEEALRAKKYSEVLKPIKASKEIMPDKRLVSRGCKTLCSKCRLPGVMGCTSSVTYLIDHIYASIQRNSFGLIFCRLRNMKYAVIVRTMTAYFDSNDCRETVHICEDPYTLIFAYSLYDKDAHKLYAPDIGQRIYVLSDRYDPMCSCQNCIALLAEDKLAREDAYYDTPSYSDYAVEREEGLMDTLF